MPQKIEEAEPAGARPMSDDRPASGRSSLCAQGQGVAMMDESAVLVNFDPIAIGDEVAALEREARSKLADAKGEFASRSEKIAAILWEVKEHHPEHLKNLFGYDQIKAFRAARSPAGLARTLANTVVTTYGRDFAIASTLFHRATMPGKVGRQMQTWVRFPDGWFVVAAHVSVIGEE